MMRAARVGRVFAILRSANLKSTSTFTRKLVPPQLQTLRSFSSDKHFPGDRKVSKAAPVSKDPPPPDAPPLTSEDLDFLDELASGYSKGVHRESGVDKVDDGNLPEPPKEALEWDDDIEEDDQEDEPADIDEEFFPEHIQKPTFKTTMITGESSSSIPDNINSEGNSDPLSHFPDVNHVLGNDPSWGHIIASWAQAVAQTPANKPMPFYALANRSFKVKELIKLGVDFSQIVERHGQLERLLHLDWEQDIKPRIRFLVDCGIEPSRLGDILSKNTPLLWADQEDLQVRINFLEAKNFSPDQIKRIVNASALWLSLPTKEIDCRLGFVQRTFKLQGSEVRSLVTAFPQAFASKKWDVFVNTTKLMDREFGFNEDERRKLLFQVPGFYLQPGRIRKTFDLLHNQVGLTHEQLARHARLLVQRMSTVKPRYSFLKFLKRDIFDVHNPMYISPDWLWQGTVEEFCKEAAKTSLEEYENFLKHSWEL